MKYIILICVMASVLAAAAQGPNNDHPSFDPSKMPQVGKISGSVQDATTGKPMEFATIALVREKDSTVVTGTITDGKGKFSMTDLPVGKFRVEATFIGYDKNVTHNVLITPKNPEIFLDPIKLSAAGGSMEQAVIQDEKQDFTSTIDKQVFNVDKNLIVQGGNATDVLNQVPSVSVDIDGKISFRGTENVKVLIDGKPSGLTGPAGQTTLESIPASSIESVELITNPSAKYDPDGMGGIINIVLKKNRRLGLSGSLSASAGTHNNYNVAGMLNYKTKKLNFYSNYSFNYRDRLSTGTTLRDTYINDTTFVLNQYTHGTGVRRSNMIRMGVDYDLNEKNTISLSGTYNYNTSNNWQTINYQQSVFDSMYENYYRFNNSYEVGNSFDGDMSLKHLFKNPKQTWITDLSYSTSNEDENSKYRQEGLMSDAVPELQNNDNLDLDNMYTLQSDLSLPLKGNSKIEAGIKGSYERSGNDVKYWNYDSLQQEYLNDTTLSNNFVYNQQLYSGYATYTGATKYFGYQVGLRLEQQIGNSELTATDSTSKYNNNYFSYFPSAIINKDLGKGQQIKLSYSRRVNRPWGFSMNPFPDRSDPLLLREGNPELKPEYINSFELGYTLIKDKVTFTSSLYYRRTMNMVTRYTTVDNGISISKPLNLGTGDAFGAELYARWKIAKWWNVSGNFNLFQSYLYGTYNGSEMNNSGFGWFTKESMNFTLPKSLQIQVSGNYSGPMYGLQGYFKARSSVDAGARKDIFKGKANVGVNVSDIFNTQQFGGVSDGVDFHQEMTRKRLSRVATATFTWFFGKQDDTRKNKRMDNNPGGDTPDIDSF